MTPDAINRAARQIALPQIGLDGQTKIAAATAVVAGDDLACEVVARALAAAGLGKLRLVRRSGEMAPEIAAALASSNPDLQWETLPWPGGADAGDGLAGAAWMHALADAAVAVRSGFDDDPMLRAAVRLAVPVVVTRGREDGVDVVSFRRHGPCPHVPLDVPSKAGTQPQDGPGAVVAAHIAAAEALALIAGATTGTARARHISIASPGTDTGIGTGDGAGPTADPVRATDIPWTPECFACGGSGSEMSFS